MSDNDELLEYESIREFTPNEAEMLIQRNVVEPLRYVPIGVSLYADDLAWAESVCIRLSAHGDPTVRGNAVLGFGHLARRFGTLNIEAIRPIVDAALADPSEYVRMQASDANDDLRWYLGRTPSDD